MDTVILTVGLAAASVQDIKWRKIWLPFLWTVTGILILKKIMEYQRDYSGLFCALMSIVFFLIMCRVTKGQIGSGDAFLFGMTGAGLGWTDNFRLIYLTFFLASIVSMIMLVIYKRCGIRAEETAIHRGRNVFRTGLPQGGLSANVWRQEIPLSPFVLTSFMLLKLF